MGKTAAEPKATERQTIAVMMAVLRRLTVPMRGSVTFDKPRQQASGSKPEGTEVSRPRRDTTFARHSLLRGGVALRPPSLPRPAVARAFHAIKWAVQRARYMTLETISPMGHDLTLTLPTAAA